jgi:5-methylcytosine-specific restriction enzyme B
MATTRIGSKTYDITREDVLAVAQREGPRRVNSYFVEIEGRKYPPKQLLRGIVGAEENFDTGVAVRTLKNLGFSVVRIEDSPG